MVVIKFVDTQVSKSIKEHSSICDHQALIWVEEYRAKRMIL